MAETETVLLRRFARTGDAEAFAEIIRRHAGLVYGAALRILTDMDRAADVAQETFLQLTKDAGVVTGSLPGWLHRVATHKAIDQRRRETARRNRERAYMASRHGRVAEWKEISPCVDEGLNELDPELRDILVAHFLDGQTTRHIAAVRGISQATVSRRIEAGVANLRGVLRRRGIIVAAGALTLLLGENAAEAAPATLMAELGKIALVGGHAVAASATATAGVSSSLRAALDALVASAKAKVAVAATVAVIGAGSVITYQQVTKSSTPSTSDATVSAALVSQPQANAPSAAEMPFAPAAYGETGSLRAPGDPLAGPNASGAGFLATGMEMETGLMSGYAGYQAVGAIPPPANDPNDSNDRSDDPNGTIDGSGEKEQ